MAVTEAFVPHVGANCKFIPRTTMSRPFVGRMARLPMNANTWQPASTPLPVDSTADAKVACPILGNDRYGICGPAMVAHSDIIHMFRQGRGTQIVYDVNALERQYFRVSGGDNGTNEEQVVDEIWKKGIAGNVDAVCVAALDIDMTNMAMLYFCIDQYYTAQMAWSVPDRFRNGFAPGSVWPNAMRPNPMLGHYTTLADVAGPNTPIPDIDPDGPTGGGRTYRAVMDALVENGGCPRAFAAAGTNLNGFLRNWTWGSWAWCSPAFIVSVRPDGFVVFSTRMYDKATGLDSKGRHIRTQAGLWVAMGGDPIPEAVLAQFPAKPDPKPVPTPGPVPGPVGGDGSNPVDHDDPWSGWNW